jgi:hypothetical protein
MMPTSGIHAHRNATGWECQDFRVWAGTMGKKESQYASTQRTRDPQ